MLSPTYQLLPHFCFPAVHFRGELHYVGHVGYQKNRTWTIQNSKILEQDLAIYHFYHASENPVFPELQYLQN